MSKNIKIIFSILLITILILGVLFFILRPKNDKGTILIEERSYSLTNCKEEKCLFKFKSNLGGIEDKENKLLLENSDDESLLYLNNTIINENTSTKKRIPLNFYLIDSVEDNDIVIIEYNVLEDTETDNVLLDSDYSITELEVYDLDGNVLETYNTEKLKELNPLMSYIDNFYVNTTSGTIEMDVTRCINEGILDENGNEIISVTSSMEELKNLGIDNDTILFGTFAMKYEDNLTYHNPVLISSVTVKDIRYEHTNIE